MFNYSSAVQVYFFFLSGSIMMFCVQYRSKPSLAAVIGCMMPMMLGICFLCPSMDCLWHKYHYCPSCKEKVKNIFHAVFFVHYFNYASKCTLWWKFVNDTLIQTWFTVGCRFWEIRSLHGDGSSTMVTTELCIACIILISCYPHCRCAVLVCICFWCA